MLSMRRVPPTFAAMAMMVSTFATSTGASESRFNAHTSVEPLHVELMPEVRRIRRGAQLDGEPGMGRAEAGGTGLRGCRIRLRGRACCRRWSGGGTDRSCMPPRRPAQPHTPAGIHRPVSRCAASYAYCIAHDLRLCSLASPITAASRGGKRSSRLLKEPATLFSSLLAPAAHAGTTSPAGSTAVAASNRRRRAAPGPPASRR